MFGGAWNTEQSDIKGLITWGSAVIAGGQIGPTLYCGNKCSHNAIMHCSIIWLRSAVIPFPVVNGMLLFHMSLLWLYLIIWFFFFSSSFLSSFVTSLPALEPHAPNFLLASRTLLLLLPLLTWPSLFFINPPHHMCCSLLVGDCRVHCSPSCNGGQWPWGSVFIRRAGLLPCLP